MRTMSQLPITEPAETRISEPDGSSEALEGASTREELTAVAARFPTCLAAWAALGEDALADGHPVQAYAYFRVGRRRDRRARRGRALRPVPRRPRSGRSHGRFLSTPTRAGAPAAGRRPGLRRCRRAGPAPRSEEHTSELQSRG